MCIRSISDLGASIDETLNGHDPSMGVFFAKDSTDGPGVAAGEQWGLQAPDHSQFSRFADHLRADHQTVFQGKALVQDRGFLVGGRKSVQ